MLELDTGGPPITLDHQRLGPLPLLGLAGRVSRFEDHLMKGIGAFLSGSCGQSAVVRQHLQPGLARVEKFSS